MPNSCVSPILIVRPTPIPFQPETTPSSRPNSVIRTDLWPHFPKSFLLLAYATLSQSQTDLKTSLQNKLSSSPPPNSKAKSKPRLCPARISGERHHELSANFTTKPSSPNPNPSLFGKTSPERISENRHKSPQINATHPHSSAFAVRPPRAPG